MSTRFIVSAVAGVVVGYFAGPQAGFQTFAAVYGVTGSLDPNAKVQGPRLDDLKIASGAYGAPIAYIEGHPRIGGNIVWCTEKREVSHETSEDGKGGPGVDTTTFTYEVDMIVMIDEKPGTKVRRIFSNGGLVWTIADDADAQSLAASAGTDSWREIRFYDGNVDQLPDPTYEAALGVGNAPAYRGRSTIVIVGLNCGSGGQLPVLTFEVSSSSETSVTASAMANVPQDRSYIGGIPAMSINGFDLLVGVFDGSNVSSYQSYRIASDGTATLLSTSLLPAGLFVTAATGSSDVSCIVLSENTQAVYHYFSATGDFVKYDCSDGGEQGNDATKFCKRGNEVAIGANNGLAKRVWHFPVNGLGGTYITLAQNVTSVAIGNGVIYAGTFDETGIYVIDIASMTLTDTLPMPAVGCASSSAFCKPDGTLCLLAPTCTSIPGFAGAAWEWNGSAWTMLLNGIGIVAGKSIGNDTSLGFENGVFFSQSWGVEDTEHTTISFTTPRLAALDVPLDEVVERQWARAGLDLALLDASALAVKTVRAMAVSQVTSPRTVIDNLAAAYLFEAVESGDGVRMVLRGGAPVATIPFEDLGAYTGDQAAEPLPRTRGNELETTAQVTIKFANVDDDYQDGSETSARAATGSSIVTVVEVPLGLTPTEARKLADVSVTDALASIIRVGPVAMTRKWAKLEPTDVVILTGRDGSTYRTRLAKRTDAEGLLTFEGVLDDATAINSEAVTSGGYTNSTIVRAAGDTASLSLDIPILRDADNAPGYYVAAKGGSGAWRGYTYYDSVDNVSFSKEFDSRSAAVLGACTTVLGDFAGGNVFDEVNSVTVSVGDGTLSSVTTDAILSGIAPAYLIGSEIVYARTAALVSAGVYTLSGFLRGLRGTEWAIGGHAAAERFVVLQTNGGLRRVSDQLADIGILHYVKAVTLGKASALVTARSFTDTGVGLKPFAPVDLVKVDTASSTTVSWHRRSRLASRFMAPTQPPLGETAEAYDVELRDAGDVLLGTTRVTVPEWDTGGALESNGVVVPSWGIRVIGGELVAARDDQTGAYTTSKSLVRMAVADGTFIDGSPVLGNEIYQWDNDGDELYAATATFSHTVPVFYTSSKIQRLTRTAIGSVAATYTAALNGDLWGVACDGTDVWASERTSGNLRRLDKTTLASLGTYAINAGITALLHLSGDLWIVSSDTDEVIQWNIASGTETQRFSVVAAPSDILIDSGLVYVIGTPGVGVYDQATGAQVITHALIPSYFLPQRCMCRFDTYIAITDYTTSPPSLVLLDAATGDFVRRVSVGHFYLSAASGENGGKLLATVGDPGHSYDTRAYELQPAGLAGCSLTVYQVSAEVGRGYPATIQF